MREPDEMLMDYEAGAKLACNVCPHFDDQQYGKGLLCKKDYLLTCYDTDADEPFTLRVKGSAIGVFKYRLISAVAMGRKAPWFAQFEMTAVKRTNDRKQSWYSPELKLIEAYDESARGVWEKMATAYVVPVAAHEESGFDPDDLPFE